MVMDKIVLPGFVYMSAAFLSVIFALRALTSYCWGLDDGESERSLCRLQPVRHKATAAALPGFGECLGITIHET